MLEFYCCDLYGGSQHAAIFIEDIFAARFLFVLSTVAYVLFETPVWVCFLEQ